MKPGECRYADAHMAVATPEGGGRQDTSCCLLGGVSPLGVCDGAGGPNAGCLEALHVSNLRALSPLWLQ